MQMTTKVRPIIFNGRSYALVHTQDDDTFLDAYTVYNDKGESIILVSEGDNGMQILSILEGSPDKYEYSHTPIRFDVNSLTFVGHLTHLIMFFER